MMSTPDPSGKQPNIVIRRKLGTDLCLVPSATPDFLPAVADALKQLLHQPGFRQQASRLQSAYGNRDSDAALAAIADRCIGLATG